MVDDKTEAFVVWKNKLRSGDFQQVNGTMKGMVAGGEIGYYCLGVLHEQVLGKYIDPNSLAWFLKPDDAHSLGLDKPITPEEWEILTEPVQSWDEHNRQNALAGFNDNGYTFEGIADVLEELGWDEG